MNIIQRSQRGNRYAVSSILNSNRRKALLLAVDERRKAQEAMPSLAKGLS